MLLLLPPFHSALAVLYKMMRAVDKSFMVLKGISKTSFWYISTVKLTKIKTL